MEIGEEIPEDPKYHDMTEPQNLVDTFLDKDSHKRKPAWARELLREVERYGTPEGIHRERKREKTYNSYVALLCDIIDKEYRSIMKNDVWEIVLRPENKYVVTSKWIYNINHVADGIINK